MKVKALACQWHARAFTVNRAAGIRSDKRDQVAPTVLGVHKVRETVRENP